MTKYDTYNRLLEPVKSFADLQGRMLTKIVGAEGDDEMMFHVTDKNYVHMYHQQDCCEIVSIEDIVGDLDNLIGTPLLLVEEVSNYEAPAISSGEESYTWTYYRFRTIKGSVDIRWYGSSNGYYSEGVSTEAVNN